MKWNFCLKLIPGNLSFKHVTPTVTRPQPEQHGPTNQRPWFSLVMALTEHYSTSPPSIERKQTIQIPPPCPLRDINSSADLLPHDTTRIILWTCRGLVEDESYKLFYAQQIYAFFFIYINSLVRIKERWLEQWVCASHKQKTTRKLFCEPYWPLTLRRHCSVLK